jgi:hypothetical protein
MPSNLIKTIDYKRNIQTDNKTTNGNRLVYRRSKFIMLPDSCLE